MVIETKVYKNNQTTIPEVYRKKYDVQPGDIVEWEENDCGEIVVSFRKKLSFSDMIGVGTVKTSTNAVQLEKDCKQYQNGEMHQTLTAHHQQQRLFCLAHCLESKRGKKVENHKRHCQGDNSQKSCSHFNGFGCAGSRLYAFCVDKETDQRRCKNCIGKHTHNGQNNGGNSSVKTCFVHSVKVARGIVVCHQRHHALA